MTHDDAGTKKTILIFGCLVAILGFMHICYANAAPRILHGFTQRPVVKPVSAHAVSALRRIIRRPVMRRSVIRRPMIRRPVIRSVIARRSDDHHAYIVHRAFRRYIHYADYLWCVPYARDVSHIDLTGDAFLWWAEAAGRYARGARPEVGAVLNFRSSARIPLGHVAVVSRVIDSREILVDQANWVPDTVTRNVAVIDVSPDNNWSDVKVSIGDGRFGMVYPTYGFIYDHQPGGMIFARNNMTEVAEAPIAHKIRLIAPNRTLR